MSNIMKNKRRKTKAGYWMARWFPLIISHFVADQCAFFFFDDTVKFWGQLENSARFKMVSLLLSARSSLDCKCDTGRSGYKYLWWAGWSQERDRTSRPGKTDLTRDLVWWVHTVSLQSDSATHWLKIILQAPLETHTRPVGRGGGVVWCGVGACGADVI